MFEGEEDELMYAGEELSAEGHVGLGPLWDLRRRGREPSLVASTSALLERDLPGDATEEGNGHADDQLGAVAESLAQPGGGLLRRLDEVRDELGERLPYQETDSACEGDRTPPDACALFDRAALHRAAGSLDDAVADFTACLHLDAAFVSAYLGRGEVHREAGRSERATADFSHTLRLDPHNIAALTGRAASLSALGRYAQALGDLADALRLDPGNSRARLLRAKALAALGEHAASLEELDRAASVEPAWAEVRRARAAARLRAGDSAGARRDLDAAVGLDPSDAAAWTQRGLLRLEQNDAGGAEADLGEALRLDPALADARLGRARAWASLGRPDRAEADCSEALRRRPGWAEAMLLRGECRAGRGDRAGAVEDFDAAIATEPGDSAAWLARGAASAHRGDHAAALWDLAEAARLDPKNAKVAASRGASLRAIDRPDEALAELRRAALLDARHAPEMYALRASLHAARGEYEEALADYVVALSLDPTNLAALAGREQAQLGLRAQPVPAKAASPSRAVRGRIPTRRVTRTPVARETAPPPTQVWRVGKAVETHPALPAFQPSAGEDIDLREIWGERTVQPPPLPSLVAPDLAISPPSTQQTPITVPLMRDAPATSDQKPLTPTEARWAEEQRRAEIKERAARWADSHTVPGTSPAPAPVTRIVPSKESDDDSPGMRWWHVAAVLLVLLSFGGGVYGCFVLFNGETKLDAEEVWKEFSRDPETTSQKYKGEFVQVTGKAKVYQQPRETRTFFDKPASALWAIEFVLSPAELKMIKEGDTVTIRGRFAAAKAKDRGTNVLMSNCTLAILPARK